MTVSVAQHQAFARLLQQETAAIKALLVLLAQERQALGERDASVLATTVHEKEQQLGLLDQLAQQRSQLLQQAGLTADKTGFEAFLESDGSGQLANFWTGLEGLLRECQQQNQINGSLLETNKQVVQQALSILTGREVGQDEVYNQLGKTAGSLGQNTSFKV